MSYLTNKGMTIGGYHTYNDFNLIMTDKVISAPEPQLKYVDVPGRNGSIDMSEVTTGDVRYKDRTITVTFFVKGRESQDWSAFLSRLRNAFHGKKKQIIFDDDPNYYWVGRSLVEMSVSGMNANVTFTITAEPYKRSTTSTNERWLWDPFDFEQGIINQAYQMQVNGTLEFTLIATEGASALTVISDTAGITVSDGSTTVTLAEGTQTIYGIVIHEGENTFTFTGNGIVSIDYSGGSL